MKSMTGYGFSECSCPDGIGFSVEIRTLNRKQLDIKLNIPSALYEQEIKIRRLVAGKISRGSVDIKIATSFSGKVLKETVTINKDILKGYIERAEEVRNSLNLENNLTLKDLFELPGVIETVQPELKSGSIIDNLMDTIGKALAGIDKTRTEEGKFLQNDLTIRLGTLENLLNSIEPHAAGLPDYYRERLRCKIEEEKLATIDDDRLLREIVIYSDRCDVSEEVTRLKSHFKQFYKILSEKTKPVGRNLDFLIQEMHREINTLGVKAANTEISPLIVKFKTEIEKIREQIQNVE